MKTFYSSLHTEENRIDLEKVFRFNINEDVRKSFVMIKNIVIDISLCITGFVVIVWVFGMLAGY